ncbi:metal dependent phosphohydrolase [Desulfitobacterium sp. LBE]|uniref:bis(5'-nucleosyl)-tetraphosphatase (symmetrical) YqeK n=1 Tax=Desulfitobacterium sp. LBE TaxID=884086 RepID=UPI0011996A45|nr:bis(5'-nucleosyl)-tetraphosphatase (symmetrical) YqeK [Desulfitobacterium sp. LBE]TWH60215.1 metal dependent phosphohydrolase [Desulfitobacterium sp. LBE]
MHKSLANAFEGFSFSGDITSDALGLLHHHGREDVAKHVLAVAKTAQRLAPIYDVDSEAAYSAGLLHDISLIFSTSQMLQTALDLGLEPVAAEKMVPYLLHGKLSAAIAEIVFEVKNDSLVHAVSCHTTLCAKATTLDKVVFLADKMSWDQEHSPFKPELETALEKSLDEAVGVFLTWTWKQKDKLDAIHPWLIDAWQDYKVGDYA